MEHKLENPKRLRELNPSQTLGKPWSWRWKFFCDIGAGTGILHLQHLN